MADVKWIKITTDIFDDEKILLIESLPDSYAIITVWFKLLCLAGKQNNSGVFMMGRIAYTDKMLATIFRMKESTVTMALRTFEEFGMVEIVDGVITIPNWNKHQTLDSYEAKKERDRLYQAQRRANQRALVAKSSDTSPDSKTTQSSYVAISEEDIEGEREKDNKLSYQQIVDMYHAICISFPKIRSVTDARKKAIKARLSKYPIETFKELFEKAEASSFLKGDEGGWKASFDWLIKEANMIKVLEGNYADKPRRYGRKETVPAWMATGQRELDQGESDAIRRMMEGEAEDPAFEAQAEAMRQKMQEKYGKAAI
jgi:predicted phage replisome organizer